MRHYYDCLKEVMGRSTYYSMDPFHEGGTIISGNYAKGYKAVFDAMQENSGEESLWVIQQWQWAPYQATSLRAIPEGRLLVLDLFSDGNAAFDKYAGYAPQKAIYCTIPNFGDRTGFMGRLPSMASSYFTTKAKYPSVRARGKEPVMSTFHSKMESAVLDMLLPGTCPIILVLGRSLYKTVPEKLRPALDSGRLLIISLCEQSRISRQSAQACNEFICQNAHALTFGFLSPDSSLYPLY